MVTRRRAEAVAGFQDLVASRWSSLFRTAHLVIGDHQLAQDLVQEALVRTYVAWPRLRDVGGAEAYARRAIVTTAISWRRRRSFHERPAGALPEVAGPLAADLADSVAMHTDLWAQLHLLPPRQRTAVVLRYCEDLSEAQTAELMGCSPGSVKRHVFLGMSKLRERLGVRFPVPAQDAPEVIP